jgi:hypothetical protein
MNQQQRIPIWMDGKIIGYIKGGQQQQIDCKEEYNDKKIEEQYLHARRVSGEYVNKRNPEDQRAFWRWIKFRNRVMQEITNSNIRR